jgi:HK97 gp10 family phage protein
MSIRVSGIKQAVKALEDYKDTKTERLEKTTSEATVNVDREAKKNAPVDTGRLRASIHRTAQGLEGTVYTNVEYAPYVEFGTGSKVDVPEGLEDYAKQFKGEGKRQVNLPAQPFLYPAWEQERPKYIKRVKKILSSIR